MSKFYLNGRILDPYRKKLTGNAILYNLGKIDKDEEYFANYHQTLVRYLNENNNALYCMDNFKIFDPFGYFTYRYETNLVNWGRTDFFKADINKLCNGDYDCMVLLPSWWKCKEAWLKLFVAKTIGVKTITFRKLIKELS